MKKGLLSLLLAICCVTSWSQVYPSDCTGADSVKARYQTDAQRLAMRRVFQHRAAEMDSTQIPADRTDTALNALILIYNATTLPARDTVMDMLDIHSFAMMVDSPYKFTLNKLVMYAPEGEPWMIDFKNGIIPTSDPVINQFLTDYHLHLDNYIDLTIGVDGLEFTSDSNFNMQAIAARWMDAYPGAVGDDAGVPGDGPDILIDSVTGSYTQLRFKYGWEDCPMGCIRNRYWTFRANFDCTVTYMGSYGDTLPYTPVYTASIERPEPSVYPNPFTDKIGLKNIAGNSVYTLYSVAGNIIARGTISEGQHISVECPAGVYFLRISDRKKTRTIKLLKE